MMNIVQWFKALWAKPKPEGRPEHNRDYRSHLIEVIGLIDQDWKVGRAGTTLLVCARIREEQQLADYLKDQGKVVVVKNIHDLNKAQHVIEAAGIHDVVYVIGNKQVLSCGWALRSDNDVRIYSCCGLNRDYKAQLLGRWFKNGVRTAPVNHYIP